MARKYRTNNKWRNELRKLGYLNAKLFCEDFDLPYGLVANWIGGYVRNVQVSGGKTAICLSKLRKLFNCDNAYIDTLCEDAYQIRNGKKPSPELVELGDSEETKRLYFETVSKKADPNEIPLEKWLEENGMIGEVKCSEENGDFFEEYNIHAEEENDMDEENYWRTNDFLKEQDEIVLSKHVSEKEEITEIVAATLYGKVNVTTFMKIMNILKEEL